MILVDTSVWISLLNGSLGKKVSENDLLEFATTKPILQEVLQGISADRKRIWFKQLFLGIPRLADPVPLGCYLEAAEIYARGTRQGYTIRSSTDCLSAAIAIENHIPVWHSDRDFSAIARFTSLEAFERWDRTHL
ncbi:MAG: PIN domain nuclease [Acidobacteriia bacterium]|nr:PIN domain nuclease [Terriglobia bacterium]